MLSNQQSIDDEYRDIVHELDDYIESRNSEHTWEAHVTNFGWQKKTGTMEKFEAKTGRDLLDNILPQTENHFTIFEFKKNGFAINNKHNDNQDGDEWYYILPACKEGFHRDWNHAGICAQRYATSKE